MAHPLKIPNTLHYCWFGKAPMPPLAHRCISSWKHYLPEYTLRLWNEETFDVRAHRFVYAAYKAHKWAYVTDYVRLHALYNYGGVYMDTDVEVLQSINRFLVHSAFSGFEDTDHIPTGIMAGKEGNKWVEGLLAYYRDAAFDKKNLVTNTRIITELSRRYGFKAGNEYQVLEYDVHIYPKTVFCPKVWGREDIAITADTYTVHHFAGSWRPERNGPILMVRNIGRRIRSALREGF